ncbi:uncharacterized protein LOC122392418 [Amphibalanus amphitrite]|uniref:uncharacterized protein LOC122392418 n=1 Tax=Amphibalanus amphitrite TaxID=1232801 RepID=UPI001C912368|nr:uncharacterized protein LOC122392418 [Amphibalanus amphitrite]
MDQLSTILLSRLEIFTGEGGQDLQSWLSRFELLVDRDGKDGEKARFLLGLLGGKAFEYCAGLPEKVIKDYTQIKQHLVDRFDTKVNESHAYSEFTRASREPGEAVQDFAERVRKLARKAYPDRISAEANSLQQFVCGLNEPGLQARLLGKGHSSLDEALSHARDIQRQHAALEAMGARGSDGAALPVRSRPATEEQGLRLSPPGADERLDQIQRQVDAIQTSLSQMGTASFTTGAGPSRPVRCWKCGAPGHIRVNCPQLTRASGAGRATSAGTSACHLCGVEGHWMARCPLSAGRRTGPGRGPTNTEFRHAEAGRPAFCYCCGAEGHWMAHCPQHPARVRDFAAPVEGVSARNSEN